MDVYRKKEKDELTAERRGWTQIYLYRKKRKEKDVSRKGAKIKKQLLTAERRGWTQTVLYSA